MKKVIQTKEQIETIAISELPEHCFLGVVDKSNKYFAVQVNSRAQTNPGLFQLIGVDYSSLNRQNPVKDTIGNIAEKYDEAYVFDSAKELFDWMVS